MRTSGQFSKSVVQISGRKRITNGMSTSSDFSDGIGSIGESTDDYGIPYFIIGIHSISGVYKLKKPQL